MITGNFKTSYKAFLGTNELEIHKRFIFKVFLTKL